MSGSNKQKFLANVLVKNPLQVALCEHLLQTKNSTYSLAKKVGCAHPMLVHYQSGKNIPSLPVFCKLVAVLKETHDIDRLIKDMSEFYEINGGQYKTKNVTMEDVDK